MGMMFDHSESLTIAEIVKFDPSSQLGKSYIDESRTMWNFCGIDEGDAYKVNFYIALGLFIWNELIDNGVTVPDNVDKWYELNTRRICADGLFCS